jgi:hypothetical protein
MRPSEVHVYKLNSNGIVCYFSSRQEKNDKSQRGYDQISSLWATIVHLYSSNDQTQVTAAAERQ